MNEKNRLISPNTMLYNNEYMKHVGFMEDNECIRILFSKENIDAVSRKITQLLQGVHPQNRPILVPNSTIASVMSNVYTSRNPIVGDIYSRYIVVNENIRNDNAEIVDRTIEIIVNQIRNDYEMAENNNKLTIWNSIYGEGVNDVGLRQFPPIKIREKHPQYMAFNMNY